MLNRIFLHLGQMLNRVGSQAHSPAPTQNSEWWSSAEANAESNYSLLLTHY
jgi:hypothetical protein